MASPLNQYAIYDCNILRINLNEMVERRASSQGKELTDNVTLNKAIQDSIGFQLADAKTQLDVMIFHI